MSSFQSMEILCNDLNGQFIIFKGNAGSQFIWLFCIIKVTLHKAQIISFDKILHAFCVSIHLDLSYCAQALLKWTEYVGKELRLENTC